MELIQIYLFGEKYGLFTYERTQDPTMLVKKCREIAQKNYENDVEDILELEQEFIDQLEESGIKRIFINHKIFL